MLGKTIPAMLVTLFVTNTHTQYLHLKEREVFRTYSVWRFQSLHGGRIVVESGAGETCGWQSSPRTAMKEEARRKIYPSGSSEHAHRATHFDQTPPSKHESSTTLSESNHIPVDPTMSAWGSGGMLINADLLALATQKAHGHASMLIEFSLMLRIAKVLTILALLKLFS